MRIHWKKNTLLFLTGQALSFFGTMVVQYAIMWHITLKTQSGTMMTLFTVAGFLPMFFISPFGGVWADRFNRKYIINITTNGAIALASLHGQVSIQALHLIHFCSSISLGALGLPLIAPTGQALAHFGTAFTGFFINTNSGEVLTASCRAAFIVDVGFVFLTEPLDGAYYRIGRGLPKAAEGRTGNRIPQAEKQLYISIPALSFHHAFQNLQHPLGSFPAGDALAAGFFLGKVHEEPGDLHHVSLQKQRFIFLKRTLIFQN
jgi:hypothetical protein